MLSNSNLSVKKVDNLNKRNENFNKLTVKTLTQILVKSFSTQIRKWYKSCFKVFTKNLCDGLYIEFAETYIQTPLEVGGGGGVQMAISPLKLRKWPLLVN